MAVLFSQITNAQKNAIILSVGGERDTTFSSIDEMLNYSKGKPFFNMLKIKCENMLKEIEYVKLNKIDQLKEDDPKVKNYEEYLEKTYAVRGQNTNKEFQQKNIEQKTEFRDIKNKSEFNSSNYLDPTYLAFLNDETTCGAIMSWLVFPRNLFPCCRNRAGSVVAVANTTVLCDNLWWGGSKQFIINFFNCKELTYFNNRTESVF